MSTQAKSAPNAQKRGSLPTFVSGERMKILTNSGNYFVFLTDSNGDVMYFYMEPDGKRHVNPGEAKRRKPLTIKEKEWAVRDWADPAIVPLTKAEFKLAKALGKKIQQNFMFGFTDENINSYEKPNYKKAKAKTAAAAPVAPVPAPETVQPVASAPAAPATGKTVYQRKPEQNRKSTPIDYNVKASVQQD